ncbi:MAG: arginase [Microbacteriaceae bacterium]|jgi:arginase|nr:arginase [Microbacteriaceae bacterium]
MRLVDGADAIRGDLPASSTVVVDVPLDAGNDEGTGVLRLSTLRATRDAQATALRSSNGVPITIGGDCGVELAAISHAIETNPEVAVVWLGAHPDLQAPDTSPSGAFHGMVLRTLLGEGEPTLVPGSTLSPSRLILGGTRALDDSEAATVQNLALRTIPPTELTPDAVREALGTTGASCVYIHLDLDVLDPAEFAGLAYPEPFGMTLASVLDLLNAITTTLPLIGAGITEFAPESPEAAGNDLGSVLRIIGSLSTAARALDPEEPSFTID